MHELSIAQNIVEIIEQYVPPANSHLVREVKVKVGAMSGVVADSLEFCFSAITASTNLQKSRLAIERVPFIIKCKACDITFSNESGRVVCPKCGDTDTSVVGGTELFVVEIELDEIPEHV